MSVIIMISEVVKSKTIDEQFLSFYIDKELVVIKLSSVETIEFIEETTPIPRAPSHVLGVANIENSIIPIIDLEVLLNIRRSQVIQNAIAVIISIETAVFGIYIATPPKVITFDELIEIKPTYHSNIPSHWITSYLQKDNDTVAVLEPNKFWIGLGESEIIGPSARESKGKSVKSKIKTKVEKKKHNLKEDKEKVTEVAEIKEVIDATKAKRKDKPKEDKDEVTEVEVAEIMEGVDAVKAEREDKDEVTEVEVAEIMEGIDATKVKGKEKEKEKEKDTEAAEIMEGIDATKAERENKPKEDTAEVAELKDVLEDNIEKKVKPNEKDTAKAKSKKKKKSGKKGAKRKSDLSES